MPSTPKPERGRRRDAHVDTSGNEPTWVGAEGAGQVSHRQLVQLREQNQTYRMQIRALRGLWVLLPTIFLLGASALVGAAGHLITEGFALGLLGLTVTPSVGAWVLVVRWAFRTDEDGGPPPSAPFAGGYSPPGRGSRSPWVE